jgi:broad specificity phosphatase PhoE
MSTTKLFLIRHGQTDWNLAGKLQGHADIPLNATGKEQAQKVAQFLRKKQISLQALYSSDLQRAHQTAQEISKLFALEIILASDLREGHFGKMQGLTNKEIHELYGPMNHESLPEIIEAEPRDKVVARVMNYLHIIVQKHRGHHVAIVTHGWVLHSLLAHLGHNADELPPLTNESITTFIWHADRKMFIFESIEHA